MGGTELDYINKEGYPEQYEAQNVKLKIRKENNVDYKHEEDADEYYDDVFPNEDGYDYEDYDEPRSRAQAERDYDYGIGGPNWAGD